MRKLLWLGFLPLLLVALGCPKSEITESDTEAMRKEFSEDNYEKNMRALGKGAEYEAEKQRQNQHYQGGQSPDGS